LWLKLSVLAVAVVVGLGIRQHRKAVVAAAVAEGLGEDLFWRHLRLVVLVLQ
jgi:hypothetical protein